VHTRFTLTFTDPLGAIHGLVRSDGDGLIHVPSGAHALPPATISPDNPATGPWRLDFPTAPLTLTALGPAVDFAAEHRVWLCTVTGELETKSGPHSIDAVGAFSLEPPPPAAYKLRRHLWLAFGEEFAVLLEAAREGAAAGHGQERIEAFVLRGTPLVAGAVERPRLSSSYDASGQLSHAGLELLEHEPPGQPLRIGAEPLARADLPPLAATFLHAHHNGSSGVGCYLLERSGA
jgi:hypothetical protein